MHPVVRFLVVVSELRCGMNFPGYVLLFDAAALYWILSLCLALLRRNKVFHALTRYGARQVGFTSDAEKLEDSAIRYSGGKGASRLRLGFRMRMSQRLQAAIGKALSLLRASFLGQIRVKRRWSFCAFYATGLLTCICLFLHYPESPCREAAEAGVRSYLHVPPRAASEAAIQASVQRAVSFNRRANSAWDANQERRFQENWRQFVRTHPWLVQSPFLDLRNTTRIEAAHELYTQETQACEAHVVPLLHWEQIPLLMFASHCFIRLLESAATQAFSNAKHDSTTLFGLLAGCSFYVFAAISADLSCFASLRHMEAEASFLKAGLLPSAATNTTATSSGSVLLFSQHMEHAVELTIQDHYQRFEVFGGVLGVFSHVVRLGSYILPRTLLILLVIAHVALQWVQAYHHEMLASLRRGPEAQRRLQERMDLAGQVRQKFGVDKLSQAVAAKRDRNDRKLVRRRETQAQDEMQGDAMKAVASSALPENEACSEAQERLKEAVFDDNVWAYRYPYKALFQVVLEPHYLCEIMMFIVQGSAIGLILFYSVFAPAARFKHSRLLPWFKFFASDHAVPSVVLVMVLISHLVALLGVLFFTTVNLCFTAEEHREFWRRINEKRVLIKEFVLEKMVGLEDVEGPEAEASRTFWQNRDSPEYSHTRALMEADKLERQVIKRRMRRRLFILTDPEMLPFYNLAAGCSLPSRPCVGLTPSPSSATAATRLSREKKEEQNTHNRTRRKDLNGKLSHDPTEQQSSSNPSFLYCSLSLYPFSLSLSLSMYMLISFDEVVPLIIIISAAQTLCCTGIRQELLSGNRKALTLLPYRDE
eukprot:gene8657-6084_t